jgi:hypothetical protein
MCGSRRRWGGPSPLPATHRPPRRTRPTVRAMRADSAAQITFPGAMKSAGSRNGFAHVGSRPGGTPPGGDPWQGRRNRLASVEE